MLKTGSRIMVTGAAGYIGSVMARQLIGKGYRVRGVDILRSGGESLIDLLENEAFEFCREDIRDSQAMSGLLQDVDAVVHMAAIVGDPACKKEPALARETNLEASCRLYDQCEKKGVQRFVFASTCSNYGKMKDPDAFVTEESELSPISLYAETKVGVEKYLLSRSRENSCKPTVLRFSTVYGMSPRLRFDLTVNDFTKEIAMGRELTVFGEQFWRPYCHVADLARSVAMALEGSPEATEFQVYNVGDTDENYQKQMIVEEVLKQIPEARVHYVHKNEDPRDYRVDFSKIRSGLGFSISRRVPDGIREVAYLIREGFVLNPDDPKYYNVNE